MSRLAELLGDGKIGQVGVLVLVQEHVRRLDIAVHEAAPVGGVKAVPAKPIYRCLPLRTVGVNRKAAVCAAKTAPGGLEERRSSR